MTAPVHSALSFSGVGLTWPDGTVAFDGLDLLVPPGRSGLVGANGSGRSTLLRLAAGALEETARGSLLVVSHDARFLEDVGVDRTLELRGTP